MKKQNVWKNGWEYSRGGGSFYGGNFPGGNFPDTLIVVRIIYRPSSQSDLLEIINTHFSKLDTCKNEIYILGDFNIINLYLNKS